MNKRRKYLILIIVCLIIEIIIIYIGNVRDEKYKIKAEKSQTTGQIIGNEIENIDTAINDIDNNTASAIIEEIEELDEDNNIISEEESNEYNIEVENVIEEQEEVIEINEFTSSYNEESFIDGHLKEYPEYGERYGSILIDKIGVDAPIIFGANQDTILSGVGHDSGSYFPGENGSIIMCEHNYMNHFNRIGELKNGDIVEIKTDYGDFYYSVYDSKIVLETETEKLPIQQSQETLMLYTCYPFDSVGHTEYRYVVYANYIDKLLVF